MEIQRSYKHVVKGMRYLCSSKPEDVWRRLHGSPCHPLARDIAVAFTIPSPALIGTEVKNGTKGVAKGDLANAMI